MAQVSYGTITITDTNDIEKIYMEYAQSQNNQTAPTTGWDDDIPTWREGYYIWQRTVTKMSGVPLSQDSYGEPVCLTGSTGSSGAPGQSVDSIVTSYCNYGTGTPAATYSGWQSAVPAYDSTKPNYWIKTVITYSNPTTTDTKIYKDNGITSATSTAAAANTTAQNAKDKADDAWDKADNAETIAGNANTAISDLNQYFWRKKSASTNVPAGSYVTNIPGTTYQQDPANGGFNSLVQANGIFLRNGIATLSSWTGNALTFYHPTNSGQGNRGMELSSSTLKFYDSTGTVAQATFGGTQATVSGTINVYDGKIGNASNYWYIGNYTDYNQNDSAIIKSIGTASIQLNETNTWRIATNRIHTAWAPATGTDAYKLHFPIYVDSENTNRHWDYGLHLPTSYSDKFLYIRNAASSETLDNLLDDLDDAGYDYWNYIFYIDGSGNLHAGDIYSHGTLISGTSAPYLLKSGGTMTGNITMSNGAKLIGDVTGNVSGSAGKLSNTSKIGDTNKPVYFSANGVPVAISYEINKSVPSNAIFTDQNVRSTQANTTKLWLVGTPTSGDRTGELNYDSNIYADTTAGALHATTFEGNLSGTASRATADSDGNTIKTTYLKLTGGNVTGAVTFGSSVSVDELTAGDLVVNGNASFTNNLQANTINGVEVGSNPKFTDTVTTVTVTGSGNAVTSASASNGAVTLTKGTTFPTGSGTNGYLTKWTGANTIGNGPALGSDTTKFLNNKGEWAVPTGTYTYTLPLAANGTRGGVQIGYTTSGKNYAVQLSNEKMYVNVPWENTTYSAGTGLSLSGTTFNHSNSVTAGTAGTSSATSGATLAVPYVTYDAQGHITGSGTHTHTINSLSADVITGGYLNIHPENSPTLIPFMHNDIAHLLKRGGSAVVKYDNTTQNFDLTNCFDGSGSYWAINPSGTTTITIELTLHKVFGWTNTIYIDFGSSSWRSKSVKIEVMNSNYTDDVWTQKYTTTTNGLGHVYVITSHQPVGASNTGGGFNKIRFTFSDWNSATIFRIAQLGVYNYGSAGLRETYMSRGADDPIFRSITPYSNNTYNLGSSSNKWSNVYATTLTGTLDGPVKDSGNGTNTTFAYSKAGLDSTSWFAAWNGYELRAISPAKTKSTLSLSKSDVGLGNVLNFKQVTAIGQGANGTLRVWTGDPSSTSTNDYTDVAVTITAYEQSSVQKAEALNLSAAVGSTNKPVYFKADGKPYAISYTIDKSVPSDAVFTDTTYTAGSGLTLDGTQFKHSNSITAGTIADGGSTRTLGFGGTFKIPSITYDAQGHIKSTTTITLTMPAAPSSTDNATNDSDGNPINTTYIKKSIGTAAGDIIYWSASGTPVRLAKGSDGQVLKLASGVPTWGTDNNTWRGIQNNLTSDSTTDSLSAAQGKALANGSARDSTKLPLAGGTMAGQIKTSFKSSVATGSYLSSQTTIPELCEELRYSSGVMGSVNISTAYTKDGITIATGWYNFLWVPHRSGGVNGAASGDNCDYGSLYLSGMTLSGLYMIRYASKAIIEVKNLYKPPAAITADSATTATTATEFNSNATVTLTGDTTGTSAGSKKSWSVTTTTSRLSGLGRRSTVEKIALNPSIDTGFKISWHISDSTARTNDATNSPSFDAGIINIPWDWGAYNGQIAIANDSTTPRIQIRAASHTDHGEGANPRYTPDYGAWREVVTATKATQVGSATQPVYVSNTGQITAGTTLGGAAYQAADYYVKKSGDTMTGALNTASNIANKIGDDSQLGDFNVAGTLGIQGLNGTTGIALLQKDTTWGSSGNYVKIGYDGTTATISKQTTVTGNITSNGLLKSTNSNNTVTIGSQNASFTHIYNSASIPFIFNNSILTTSGSLGNTTYPFTNINITGGYNMLVSGAQKASMHYDSTLAAIVFSFA